MNRRIQRVACQLEKIHGTDWEIGEQLVLPCPSPCVKKCGIDETLHCSGCKRTGLEVATWRSMPEEQKWDLLEVIRTRGI